MRKRCINKNDFSDITFLIGPKREPIHAHRAMLAARSEVFRTVLKQQLVNGNNKQGWDEVKLTFDLTRTVPGLPGSRDRLSITRTVIYPRKRVLWYSKTKNQKYF